MKWFIKPPIPWWRRFLNNNIVLYFAIAFGYLIALDDGIAWYLRLPLVFTSPTLVLFLSEKASERIQKEWEEKYVEKLLRENRIIYSEGEV